MMLHGWLANPPFIDDVLKPSFTLGTLPPTSMLDCLKFNRIFGRLHPASSSRSQSRLPFSECLEVRGEDQLR